MENNTPTPWEIRPGHANQIQRANAPPGMGKAIAACADDHDAAHIVKCVNVHDDLAKVLKLSTNVLETMHAIEADDDARRMLGDLIMANRAVLEKAGAA